METDKSKVVSVMSFNSVMEAQLYKALLESAGVQACMLNDLAAQVVPAYGSLMQINLLVADEDQKKAREILGAKFDIDEFHRQVDGSGRNHAHRESRKEEKPAKKTPRKPVVKAAENTAAAPKAPAAKKAGRPKKKAAAVEK